MSDTSALSELAKFVAKSPLANQDVRIRRQATDALAASILPESRPKVTDLLGIVMALSSRTRRMVQSRVDVDVDVFAPNNRRAIQLRFGTNE